MFHDHRVNLLSRVVGGAWMATDALELQADLPLVWAKVRTPAEEDSSFVVGNLFLAASYVHTTSGFRYRLGGGVAAPIARADDLGQSAALAASYVVRAGQEAWYWAVDAVPVVAAQRFEHDVGQLFLGLDAGASFWVPTGDRGDAELFMQFAPGAGARIGELALIGARLPVVVIATGGGALDDTRVGIEPYLRVFWDSPFVMARATILLDEPNSFDDGGMWGVHIGFGMAF